MRRQLSWAGIVCTAALAAVPATVFAAPPQLRGYWLESSTENSTPPYPWSTATSLQVEETGSGFIARTVDPVTRWPRWTEGAGGRGPCADPPPVVPAGAEWARGSLVSPGIYDVTFNYLGFDMVDGDGVQPGPASNCRTFPVTYRMQLLDYQDSLARQVAIGLPAGKPGTLSLLGIVKNGVFQPGVAGGVGDGHPGCPYYGSVEPHLEFCEEGIASVAQDAGDEDRDGLPDSWERRGVRLAGQFVDLPTMGASPRHKDVFVQLDSRSDTRLDPVIIERAAGIFARAPVDNPDGRRGISLHVDGGPDTLMDEATGRKWHDLSRAHSNLSFADALGAFNPPVDEFGCNRTGIAGSYNWTNFEDLARDNLSPSRKPIFRYAISAWFIAGNGHCASGLAHDLPSSEFLFATHVYSHRHDIIESFPEWARLANFLHELGHTLGLAHGGFEDANSKPNYLSLMNYLYVWSGWKPPGTPKVIDYSRTDPSSATTIDERSIVESDGLTGIALPPGSEAASSCPTTHHDLPLIVGMPVDANCDGSISTTPLGIELDDEPGLTVLQTQNDWENLSFVGGAVGGPNRPFGDPDEVAEPMTADETLELLSAHDKVAPHLKASIKRSHGKRYVAFRARDDQEMSGVVVSFGSHERSVDAPFSKQLTSPKRLKGRVRLPGSARRASAYALDQAGNASRLVELP